ncbi:hypothetical protein BDV26DRAFT_285943 [Aspergillus bertholletiae]|uniref:Uncharacterized protein n=1 Tax=Aspergillus bertholletiae TaxID=1226010 RepID=A0A5N7ARF8_9EURO|nr:hypothetical protein BDV26DRAFT_285943 [Aspergillus bertholletiae]
MDKRRLNLRTLASPGTFFSSSGQSESDPLFLRPLKLGKLLEGFRRMTQFYDGAKSTSRECRVFTRMVAESDKNRRKSCHPYLGEIKGQFRPVPPPTPPVGIFKRKIFHFPSLPIIEIRSMSKFCYVCVYSRPKWLGG